MSINNCQAIQKSCIDRKSNAWFTLGSESKTLVSLGRSRFSLVLNDRQSEFRESSEPIMYKLSVQYINWEVSSDPKNLYYDCYKYENMQDCKIVTPDSYVCVSYEVWRLFMAGNF